MTDYEYSFYKAVSHFPCENNLLAQEFYEMVYNEISIEYRMKILIKIIYGEFDTTSVISLIDKCLQDEPKEVNVNRIQEHISLLKEYIAADNTVTVYRGINSSNYGKDGISWTLDKLTAESFSLNGDNSQVIKGKIVIKDILAFNDLIGEAEIIVLPNNVQIIDISTFDPDADMVKKLKENSRLTDKKIIEIIREKEKEAIVQD